MELTRVFHGLSHLTAQLSCVCQEQKLRSDGGLLGLSTCERVKDKGTGLSVRYTERASGRRMHVHTQSEPWLTILDNLADL